MNKQKILYTTIITLCGIIIILAADFLIVYFKSNKISDVINKITQPLIYTHFSKLDGSGVNLAEEETPSVVAVMIDNHPEAWPQSGLSKARVVYEAPVEGDFTRYLAVYLASTTVAEVGPVRSARPYFLDWLREYGIAPYMHSGGSPSALAEIKSSNIFDANEFWWGRYYWRSDERSAPHNLYTNNMRWQELLVNDGSKHAVKNWEGWVFNTSTAIVAVGAHSYAPLQSAPTANATAIKSLKISFNQNYIVEWKYNEAIKNYSRFVNGLPVADKDGSLVKADNILVQFTSVKILDEEGRKELQTIGSGEARVVSEGFMLSGNWKKTDTNSRTRFYTTNNEEIKLKPGVTWVEVAPNGLQLEIGN